MQGFNTCWVPGTDHASIATEAKVMKKLADEKIDKSNVIDTLELARDKFPGSQISLDALCKRFRIDNSKRTKHNALIDCELLSKVYINLIDQKEPMLNFENLENEKSNYNFKTYSYCKKIVGLTEKEINLHKKYLSTNLKKNFFT